MNLRTSISALIFSIALLTLSCDPPADDQSMDRAKTSEENSAFSKLNALIKEQPNNGEAYYERAAIFEGQGQMQPALADIQRALTLESDNSSYHSRLGRLLFKTGDMSGAKREFDRALSLNSENIEGLLLLGELYFVLKEYDEAMVEINKALRIDEQQKKGYFLKGMIYKELGDTTLAISSLQTVAELDPDDTETFLILGILHAGKGDALALDYYDAAIVADPKSVEGHYNKGIYLQSVGSSRAAIDEYEQIIDIDPDRAVAYYNIGYVQMTQLDNADSALYFFSQAIEKNPRYYQAYYNRGYSREVSGDLQGAREDYQVTLELSPNNDLALDGLNRIEGR